MLYSLQPYSINGLCNKKKTYSNPKFLASISAFNQTNAYYVYYANIDGTVVHPCRQYWSRSLSHCAVAERSAAALRVAGSIPARNKYLHDLQIVVHTCDVLSPFVKVRLSLIKGDKTSHHQQQTGLNKRRSKYLQKSTSLHLLCTSFV